MKKIISIIVCVVFTLEASGCFSYKDINKMLFVMCVIVDVDKDNRPVIYLEAFKPFRSSAQGSEKGQRVLLKGTGKSAYEALRDIHLATSYKLNYTQNKVLMFTTKAAKIGVDNWIDIFDRHQEFVIRPYFAITDESPMAMLKLIIAEQEYLGILIKDVIDNEGASTRAVRIALNEYLSRRLIGSETCVATLVGIKKDQPEQRPEISGGAILRDDKLIDTMPRSDGQGYNFLMNTLKTGSLEVSNPEAENNFISLNILRNYTKTDIEYNGTVIKLKKTINVKANIQEIEKRATLNETTRRKLEEKSKENILKACNRVFEKYKEMNLDIFQVTDLMERKYPKVKIDNPLKITQLEIKINENIEGSPDTQDFWE